VDVARDYPVEAFSGPLTVALGAEYRREEYEIGAGDVASYSGSGAQGFSGFRGERRQQQPPQRIGLRQL
jgi:iron complex outermembrane receptor protein